METMRTKAEIQEEYLKILEKREKLVKEYRKTHKLPSRGRIADTEILELDKKIVQLGKEYLSVHK